MLFCSFVLIMHQVAVIYELLNEALIAVQIKLFFL